MFAAFESSGWSGQTTNLRRAWQGGVELKLQGDGECEAFGVETQSDSNRMESRRLGWTVLGLRSCEPYPG